MSKKSLSLLVASSLLLLGLPAAMPLADESKPRVIHSERSLYRNIIVTEDDKRRCMTFIVSDLASPGQNQSCRYQNPLDRDRLIFPYGKMVLSSLLVQDNPQRILIIGLGGGSLVQAYSTLFPDAEIIAPEIDEAVVRVAKNYFDFKETDKISAPIEDGRVYVKRAGLRGEKFDLVILDAFNGEYIPEHLMTKEFLEEVKRLLSEKGLVAANTFAKSQLYDAESVTYNAVFGQFYNLRHSSLGSRVIIASMQPLPDRATLEERAADLYGRLQRFDMNVTAFPEIMATNPDWDASARMLTDQYAPVNQLNN